MLTTLPDQLRVMLASRTPLAGPLLAILSRPVVERGSVNLALSPEVTCRVLRAEHRIGDPDIGYLVPACPRTGKLRSSAWSRCAAGAGGQAIMPWIARLLWRSAPRAAVSAPTTR